MKIFVFCIAFIVVTCVNASPLSEEIAGWLNDEISSEESLPQNELFPLTNDNVDDQEEGEMKVPSDEISSLEEDSPESLTNNDADEDESNRSTRDAAAVEEIIGDYDSDENENEEASMTQDEMEKMYGIPIPICLQFTDNVHPLHLSHLSDCGKFYKCSNGRGFLLDCPIGEHWNVKLNRCDYTYSANCIADGVYRYRVRKVKPAQASFQVQLPEGVPQPPQNEVEIIPEFEIDPRCEGSDPFKPLHFKHKSDCNKFYKCYMGKAYVLKCPKYQQWSQDMSRCEHPSTARCTVARPAAVPAAQGFEVIGVGSLDDDYYDYSEVEEEADYRFKDTRCLAESRDRFHPIQFQHPTDCGSFYKCFDDTAFKVKCPAGLYYSVVTEQCDYAYKVRCGPGIVPASEITNNEKPQKLSVADILNEHPEMKDYYSMLQKHPELMSNYYMMMQRYPGMMQQFPQMPMVPNSPPQLQQPQPLPEPNTPQAPVPLPQPFPQPSPEFPSWMPIPQPNVPLPDFADSSDSSLSDNKDNFNFKDGKVSKKCPNEDEALDPVHLGHENDCSKFYKCFGGRAFLMDCPTGQEWSDSLQRCDFHEFANCDPIELVKKKIQL